MIATVLQLDFAAVRLSRRHEKTLLEATQRLSTGRRLNSAADAPASVGRVRRLEAQRRGVERGHRNVEESRSLLHLREGLLRQRLEIVQHLREMAVRSVHGTLSAAERAATEREADEYVASYGELANLRRFGRSVLDATTLEVSLGETGNSLQLTTENSDAETLIDFEYAGGLSTRRVNSGDIVINGIDIGDVVGSQATSGCTTCLRNPFALEGAIDAVASQTGVTAEVVRATTSARYVRYTIESTHSGTNELDISQLQIFDVDGFILNRSGWTATSSSTTGDASHVVGGSSTQFITGAAEPLPITLTVDMGVEQIVSMSRFQQTDGTRRIKDLLIETSTDGSTWRTAFSGDVEDTQWATNAFDEVRIVLSSEAPIVLEGAAVEDGFRDAGARGTLASTPLDLEVLDLALTELSGQLASVGAQLSGTERLASHLSQGSDTLQAARARVEETDYTQESRRFARSRILQSLALGYRAQAFEGLARIVDELL